MSHIHIKQHDISDCGAACLASIAAYYKLRLPLSKIRQYLSTDKEGTNILGLLEGAQKMGFDAKGVKADTESLYKVPKPAIAHVLVDGRLQHYVVIYELRKKTVRLMDPAVGRMTSVPMAIFEKQWTGVLVILVPNDDFVPRNEKASNLLRFWQLLKPHKATLIQALIGSLCYTILGFSTSIYIQKITDHVLLGDNLKLLNIMGVVMIGLLLIQLILSVLKDIFLIRTGQEIDGRLIMGYYKHLLKLHQRFFDTMRVGEILSRINDAVKIRMFINNTSLTLMVNFFIVVISFILMFTYYWKLGLLMVCMLPIYAVIYYVTNRLNKKTERSIMESSAELESQLVESLNSIATVKLFGLETKMTTKTEFRFIKLLKIGYRSSLNQIFSQSSTQGIANLFTILLLWIGSYYVIARELSPGELLSFYAIIGYFTGPVSGLISSNKIIQNALIAADRLFEVLDLEIDAAEKSFPIKRSSIEHITFKNVSFRYNNRRTILSGLNICFKKGEIAAIVGESGSGKSTITHLIQALYPLHKGHIFFGEQDIRYVSKASLRACISIVPQTIHLFNGTVLENIAMGEERINMIEIQRICRKLEMIPFIESLPGGFHSHIGENGATLSGGQKQRIAIARALYRDPEILILDEATSSLDSYSDRALQNAITEFKNRKKIVILISHRLHSIAIADKILVIDKGKLAQEGTHHELISCEGVYQNLWNNQFPEVPVSSTIN